MNAQILELFSEFYCLLYFAIIRQFKIFLLDFLLGSLFFLEV